ncbi:MAG: type IX secretion system membrane protein PorP/SprF, partial [Flavobacteriales bacterium]|nr:type IX secretion system membrane protein PorP/SprF [Flavobacteriales bacterium]
MIRALSIVFLLIIVSACQAQQVPQYSHYIFNQFQLNPAVAGTG